MTIPRIVVLLVVALIVTGCATGYGEHQAALAAFNDDVARERGSRSAASPTQGA